MQEQNDKTVRIATAGIAGVTTIAIVHHFLFPPIALSETIDAEQKPGLVIEGRVPADQYSSGNFEAEGLPLLDVQGIEAAGTTQLQVAAWRR